MSDSRVKFAFEYPQRLRVGFVGCGGQAYRNLLPSLLYAPAQLIATCDVDGQRAQSYADLFGAQRAYTSYEEMIEKEQLDAVFFATGYDETGRPLYPVQAAYALRAGCHVWIEKPPAASLAEIELLQRVSRETNRMVGVGFMKMFTPAAQKVREVISLPEFGQPTTFYLRDPEKLPPRPTRQTLSVMRHFLDHIVHPVSLFHFLLGPIKRLHLEEGPDGEPIFLFKFEAGAAGVLHMPWGQSGASPMERLEVVGQHANVVVENNVRIIYYRPATRGFGNYQYGRTKDFWTPNETAPLIWEMDCYSGQPYNMHIFYQGYAPQIISFCHHVLDGEAISVGGLVDAWHITRFFEAAQTLGTDPIEFQNKPSNPGLTGDDDARKD